MSEHKNPFPNENNTGHFWDKEQDIRELNNRPPRWYMIALYISAISVVIYTIYYPTIPWFGEHTKGVANWTSISEYKESVKALNDYKERKFSKQEKAINDKNVAEILQDKELTNYAVKTAKTLFGDNCAACHGAGGQGNVDFPVLLDDDWLYGGTINNIHTSILNGRKGNMPAHRALLTDKEANTLTDFVLSKGKNAKGKSLYMTKGCVACHLPTMTGFKILGGANLTDSIYRFRSDNQKDSILRTILHGVNQNNKDSREAVMPNFANSKVLDKNKIKKLAIFVHQLGGGK